MTRLYNEYSALNDAGLELFRSVYDPALKLAEECAGRGLDLNDCRLAALDGVSMAFGDLIQRNAKIKLAAERVPHTVDEQGRILIPRQG